MRIYTEPRQHGCRICFLETRGHSVLTLENEILRVGVLLSKGGDVYEFRHKPTDLNLLWQSRVEPHPAGGYVEPVGRGQGSFLDYFQGGWQELFPNGGFACTYEGANLGQHGEVSVLPWHAMVVEDTQERVTVKIWTDTVRTPFRIERQLSLTLASPVLDIRWRIENRSGQNLHYSWGQHPGFGVPFLTENAVIDMPGGLICTLPEALFDNPRLAPGQRNLWPNGQGVNGEKVRVDHVLPVTANTHDLLYISDLPEAWAAIRDPIRGIGFAMRWDHQTFPYVWCWQVYGGMLGYMGWGDLYHVAIEPFTGPFGTLVDNVRQGVAPLLMAGGHHTTWLQAGLLTGDEAKRTFSGRFDQGQKTPSKEHGS